VIVAGTPGTAPEMALAMAAAIPDFAPCCTKG